MPDLPVELWSMVVSHLHDAQAPGTVTHKADLCAVARVNSNANTAASSKLYAHVQVIDFDGLFEGYDHTPTERRQPKKHWLSTIKSMRAAFSYYDIAPRMGPVMTRLLVGHNHYDRLAEMMPNLSKVQLLSDLQGPLNYSRTPNYHCWTLLSLPAQYMCQTPYHKRAMSMGSRPSPSTMMMHQRHEDLPDEYTEEEWEACVNADTIGTTGGRVETLVVDERFTAYHDLHNLDEEDHRWLYFQERIEKMLNASPSVRAASSAPFQFKLYGWIGPEQCCGTGYACTEKTKKSASAKRYHATVGDQRIPIDIQFLYWEDISICPACDEQPY